MSKYGGYLITYVMIVRLWGKLYCLFMRTCMCTSFKTTDQFLLLYFLLYIMLYILTEFAKLLFYIIFHNLCRH